MSTKKREYHTISRDVIARVERLRKRYPALGHEGLLPMLAEAGFAVDETELREFMEDRRLNPGPTATWMSNPLGRFRGRGIFWLWRG